MFVRLEGKEVFIIHLNKIFMKLKLLLLLTPMCFFAQERVTTSSGKTVLLNSNYTWKYEDQKDSGLKPEYFKTSSNSITAGLLDKIKISVKNGEDQDVNVEFSFNSKTEEFNAISIEKIQRMIDYSRDFVTIGLKNKYSFIPRKVSIYYSNDRGGWAVIWDYTAKNSYGGEVQGSNVVMFDNEATKAYDVLDFPKKK